MFLIPFDRALNKLQLPENQNPWLTGKKVMFEKVPKNHVFLKKVFFIF